MHLVLEDVACICVCRLSPQYQWFSHVVPSISSPITIFQTVFYLINAILFLDCPFHQGIRGVESRRISHPVALRLMRQQKETTKKSRGVTNALDVSASPSVRHGCLCWCIRGVPFTSRASCYNPTIIHISPDPFMTCSNNPSLCAMGSMTGVYTQCRLIERSHVGGVHKIYIAVGMSSTSSSVCAAAVAALCIRSPRLAARTAATTAVRRRSLRRPRPGNVALFSTQVHYTIIHLIHHPRHLYIA